MPSLTNIQQAAYQRRTLGTLKVKVQKMSLVWAEVDGFFENRFDELAQEIAKLDQEMAEFIADKQTKPVGTESY